MRSAFGRFGVLVAVLLVSTSLQAGTPKVGDTVWAQWKPNAWYHGKAARTCPLGLHIAFDDGDALCVHPSVVAVDKAPAEAVKVGTRVLAKWSDGKLYPATVAAVGKTTYDVRYDDGASAKVDHADVRVIKYTKPAKPAKVGDMVWAQWKPNSYYHGKVDKTCDLGLHVTYDDGDEGCYAPILVVVDTTPDAKAVEVGARILATWTDGKPYPATVTTAGKVSYLVRYDDGASGSVPIPQVRLISE